MKPRAPRQPDQHDFDRIITAGRMLVELDTHRKPMRAEFYRTTAVALSLLLQRVQPTQPLRNMVAVGEPTLTLFENVCFDRDCDFRSAVGEAQARDVATISHALLRRIAEPGTQS
jgi:hypothetical protein